MQNRLMVLRIIWGALLMGQVVFMFVALTAGHGQSGTDVKLLERACAGMFIVIVPTAFVLRKVIYRGNSPGGDLTMAGYSTGNILFWAMCEGVSFFGLVITFQSGTPGLAFAIAVAAMIVQIVNFPTGGPVKDSTDQA